MTVPISAHVILRGVNTDLGVRAGGVELEVLSSCIFGKDFSERIIPHFSPYNRSRSELFARLNER